VLFLIDVLFLETKMCFCFQCLVFGNGKVFLFPVTPFRNESLFPFQLQGKLFFHNLMLTDIACSFFCYPFHVGLIKCHPKM
jgi:hypothetical protein